MSTQHPQVTIPDTELRMLASSHVNQVFSISVALPHSYAQDDQAYPVVYVLDANGTFGLATETIRWLNVFSEIPEAIVVGIGYPVRTFKETDAGSGQAAAFLRFIREELVPFVNTNYRTTPGDNALVGFSFGGLFGLYTLFSQPDTFRRYIVGSPSVWWDKEMILGVAKDYAARNKGLAARVCMSVGGSEPMFMIAGMYKMADEMLKYEGLELTIRFFEGETHASCIPAFVSWGLRVAFAQKA
jgi:predicted alpha/beta superfamily hydrolase